MTPPAQCEPSRMGVLLPPSVVLCESGISGEAGLTPQERALVEQAVPARRAEFAAGRRCAREAMSRLGFPPVSIARDSLGAPCWPDGLLGSITHTESATASYCAAVIARTTAVAAIGVDAEPAHPLPPEVVALVVSEAESRHLSELAKLGDPDPSAADRVLFSAKEAIYKAWYPMTTVFLDYPDIEVRLRPGGGFRGVVRAPSPRPAPSVFEGRWLVADGLVLTAVVVLR